MHQAYFKDTGCKHPELLKKPALRADCVATYNAYLLLSASRLRDQMGGLLPIAISEIHAFLEVLGEKDPENRAQFMRLVKLLDSVELQLSVKK
mgnify:CR=1 FL=1